MNKSERQRAQRMKESKRVQALGSKMTTSFAAYAHEAGISGSDWERGDEFVRGHVAQWLLLRLPIISEDRARRLAVLAVRSTEAKLVVDMNRIAKALVAGKTTRVVSKERA